MSAWVLSWFVLAASAAPSTRPAVSEIAPIVDLIYDVELASAAASAQRLLESRPGHPAGLFYRGLVSYQRLILEERKSTETLKSFESDILGAQVRAQAWIATDPPQAYYYLGASEGFHARYLVAQGRFLKAVPEGTRSIRHLRRALELDPNLEDAYLGVGMYHYFRTRIPMAAKPFAFLFFGEWGNRELGLSELRRVADKGDLARTEAQSILAAIYCSDEERLWDKAAPLFGALMARYPHNPLYRLRAAYVAERRGDWGKAEALADPNGPWLSGLVGEMKVKARQAALYRFAESALLGGQAAKAEGPLRELEMQGLPEPLVDWVLLRRANVYDWQGNELGANRLYGAIKDPEAARAALLYLKQRYPVKLKPVKPLTGIEYPY